jgi:hypothetical protein
MPKIITMLVLRINPADQAQPSGRIFKEIDILGELSGLRPTALMQRPRSRARGD